MSLISLTNMYLFSVTTDGEGYKHITLTDNLDLYIRKIMLKFAENHPKTEMSFLDYILRTINSPKSIIGENNQLVNLEKKEYIIAHDENGRRTKAIVTEKGMKKYSYNKKREKMAESAFKPIYFSTQPHSEASTSLTARGNNGWKIFVILINFIRTILICALSNYLSFLCKLCEIVSGARCLEPYVVGDNASFPTRIIGDKDEYCSLFIAD